MGEDLRGWRTIIWAAWGSGAVVGLVIALLPTVAPKDPFALVVAAWLIGGGIAAWFVRSRGYGMPRRPKQMTPLSLVVALIGGGAIGVAFAFVGAASMAYDLPMGLALSIFSIVGGLGTELLVAVLRQVSPPPTIG